MAATGEEPAGTEASGLWEKLAQPNFADDYRTMLQDALQETETISLEQAESHLDVKQLQLVHKQLRLAGNLQNRQEYFLPMYLETSWQECILPYSREPERPRLWISG